MESTTEPRLIDEAMISFEEMVNELTEPVGEIIDEENGVLMGISKISIDMPIQLDVVVDENGKVHLGTTPPLYHVETSFMPIFHQLRFTFEEVEK
jgi:hypothetical protein